MNTDQLQGKWHRVKGGLRAKWGKLTDNDIAVIDGESERLIGKLQELYGIERETAKKELDVWLSGQN